MTNVPSVNPDNAEPIPDSEGAKEAWVDPIFLDQNPDRMTDEGAAPEGEAADADAGAPTKEQLDKLLETTDQAAKADGGEGGGGAAPAKGDEAEKADAAGDEGEGAEGGEGDDAGEAEGEEGEGEGEETPAKAGEKKPRRRRSRSRRERRESQREIAELKGQVKALTDIAAGKTAADDAEGEPAGEAPAAEAQAPKLEDFDFDVEEWSVALTAWTEKRIAAGTAKVEQDQAEEAKRVETERVKQVMDTFHDREDAARKRHDDYDDVVYDEAIYIPTAAATIIYESETGPEIAYWFATHQDEATKFAGMTDIQIAREVGRIEASITAEQAPAPKPETKDNAENTAEEAKPETPAAAAEQAPEPEPRPPLRPIATQAPEPIVPIAGGATPNRDPGRMDMVEYTAGRRSGKIR